MNIADFLEASDRFGVPMIDVRSPGEFLKGSIPSAVNIPLFSDAQRARVGTAYKQMGRSNAIDIGLEMVVPQLSGYVHDALRVSPQKEVLVYCWRGGMRSQKFAELLKTMTFRVNTLQGGYKTFRRYVHSLFSKSWRLVILGGHTGSGKTQMLSLLGAQGEQIIDLEGIARHKGSAFGSLGYLEQPTQEQFENNLGNILQQMDPLRPIWVEDESVMIGKCMVPKPFFDQMRLANVVKLSVPVDKRIEILYKDYSPLDPHFLLSSVAKIERKLGSENAKAASEAIKSGDLRKAISICLYYYDKSYAKGQSERPPQTVYAFEMGKKDPEAQAGALRKFAHQITNKEHAPIETDRF